MSTDTIIKVLHYLEDGINSVSAATWYAIGFAVGASILTIGIVAFIQRHHLKKYEEELSTHFTIWNVAFWGLLLTVADFITVNGPHFASLFPFLTRYWPYVSGGAVFVHATAKPIHDWWVAKRDGKKKPPFASTLPDLSPLVDQINTPVQPQAETTEAATPPANVFQI